MTTALRVFLTAVMILDCLIPSLANANDAILQNYLNQAKNDDSNFLSFSKERGRELYLLKRTHSKGQEVGCTSCHTENPKNMGRTRANKDIQPLAPISNPQRFVDFTQTEKWFTRNCQDVLERPCSIKEKGDFVLFMMSIK